MISVDDVNIARITQRLNALYEIGRADSGGFYRYTFSEAHIAATQLVAGWMTTAGLQTGYDRWGNLYGRTRNRDRTPAIMSGSHLDSVPNGGNFDGPLGVLTALEAAQVIIERDLPLKKPIEVVSFIEEEGARFSGLLGSQLATDTFSHDVDNLIGMDGTPFNEALTAARLPVPTISGVQGRVEKFVELHIEQGRRLEDAGIPIGIVTAIAGPTFMTITLNGRSDHAGATAYADRQDTLLAAAEIITRVRELGTTQFAGRAHMTVGKINAYPNVTNVVAGKTTFDIDYRAADLSTQAEIDEALTALINEVTTTHNLQWQRDNKHQVNPTPAHESIKSAIQAGAQAAGLQHMDLISWAAHDAMVMDAVADIGMIFVPCKDGRSHTPEEFVNDTDIAAGVAALTNTLIALAT